MKSVLFDKGKSTLLMIIIGIIITGVLIAIPIGYEDALIMERAVCRFTEVDNLMIKILNYKNMLP